MDSLDSSTRSKGVASQNSTLPCAILSFPVSVGMGGGGSPFSILHFTLTFLLSERIVNEGKGRACGPDSPLRTTVGQLDMLSV